MLYANGDQPAMLTEGDKPYVLSDPVMLGVLPEEATIGPLKRDEKTFAAYLATFAHILMVDPESMSDKPIQVELVRQNYFRKDTVVLGMFAGEQLVAAACLQRKNASTAEIHTLFTHPNARRRGIARALVRAALQLCLESESIARVTLDVMPGNEGAVALYTRTEFERYDVASAPWLPIRMHIVGRDRIRNAAER